MSVEALERRMDKYEENFKDLSIKTAENSKSMEFFQKAVDKFEKFSDQCTQTLVSVNNNISKLNDKYDSLKEEVGEIKTKVDCNEESHKVDTRPITKGIFTKILTIVIMAGLGIGLLISLLTK